MNTAMSITPFAGADVKKRLKRPMERRIGRKTYRQGDSKGAVLGLQHFIAGGFNPQMIYILANR